MRIVNKRKFIRSILILIFVIVIFNVCISTIFNKPKYNMKTMDYIVLKKDTLWSIAEQYKMPDQDVRDYIDKIKEINNMRTATIYEGQAITIIIYEEVK
ncbi:MAG: LysM peptidoglycan-binding domain-containing protein [Clostridia bacterium]|nr:LysM peptidoglycan-binding domain-containing protein [Clostridia bacterium]